MAYFKEQKKNSKKKISQTIRPELDIQGIARRNEQFLDTLYAVRPYLMKDDESLQLIDSAIGGLERIQPNVVTSESHDKRIASILSRLLNNIQGDSELKPYVDALNKMVGELAISRTRPRSIKEALARNYLGLQPQDVRNKGLGVSLKEDVVQNMRAIFGGKAKEDATKKFKQDQNAIQGIAKKREKRKEDEEKRREEEEREREQTHDEAIREDRERDRNKERKRDKDDVHEEALQYDKNRDEAVKQGIPTGIDSIAEKNAIHAQAIEKENEMEEAILRARENQAKREERKKENQEVQAEREKEEVESARDDGVTAKILEEIKAIHKTIEKGGVGGGTGTGNGKGKGKGKASKDSDDDAPLTREQAINKLVNEFKISREKAEEAYDSQDKKEQDLLLDEDRKEAELEAAAEDRERSMARGEAERIEQEQNEARIEELENAHAEALDMEGSNEGRIHSTGIAHSRAIETDKYRSMSMEDAHGEANVWHGHRMAGRLDDKDLAHDVAHSMDAKRDGQIAEKTKSHEEALKINEGRRLDKESAEKEAHLAERWRNLPKDLAHEEALGDNAKMQPVPVAATVEAPKPPELPEEPEEKGKGGSWLGSLAGKAVGAVTRNPVVAGVAGGALAVGGGIAAWNKYSDAGKTTRELAAEGKTLGGIAHETAQSKGYNSTREMMMANRNKTQRKAVGDIGQMEPSSNSFNGVSGSVMGVEKNSIEQGITEKSTQASSSPQIIYAPSAPAAPQPQQQERQSVHIRPIHPSFMRFQEKRMNRILFPQHSV